MYSVVNLHNVRYFEFLENNIKVIAKMNLQAL